MSEVRANRRIDLEAPDRVTVTISATFTRDDHLGNVAGVLLDLLGAQVERVAYDAGQMHRWHPDRLNVVAPDDVLDALDTLFPTRSGHVEEVATFIPTPRYRQDAPAGSEDDS